MYTTAHNTQDDKGKPYRYHNQQSVIWVIFQGIIMINP